MRIGNGFFSECFRSDAEWLSDEIAREDGAGSNGISLGHGWHEHYGWLAQCGFTITMYVSGSIVRW